MFTLKFIDGTPVPKSYTEELNKMISDACIAEELFELDELELYARSYNDPRKVLHQD
jgi:hypothetical protein